MNKKSYIISRPWGGSCGIGHQFLNWIVAPILANKYNLQYIYSPFIGNHTESQIYIPVKQWDKFLNFGHNCLDVHEIPKGLSVIELPLIPWEETTWYDTKWDHTKWKNILHQFRDPEVVFVCATNQFISIDWDFFHQHTLRDKYWLKHQRCDTLDRNVLNVAMHIRRGDVTDGGRYKQRWINMSTYVKIIDAISDIYRNDIIFHIFSEGAQKDFQELYQYENMVFHLNENMIVNFHEMVSCDVLVTGRSAVSILAGYISPNLKIAEMWSPAWQSFPDTHEFVQVDYNGNLDHIKLIESFNGRCL